MLIKREQALKINKENENWRKFFFFFNQQSPRLGFRATWAYLEGLQCLLGEKAT